MNEWMSGPDVSLTAPSLSGSFGFCHQTNQRGIDQPSPHCQIAWWTALKMYFAHIGGAQPSILTGLDSWAWQNVPGKALGRVKIWKKRAIGTRK